ncbi:NAD-dependent protein deacetylase [Rubrivirga sp.]|uniref:NAD-dependent protein deacetylase n=1 Tax=Rubrivirga sp. TaxID=1885344 RepID=UPI003B515910
MSAPTPLVPAPTLDALVDLLRGRRLAVLAGAGISTESGIPDYRGPETRHVERRPVQYDDFVRDPAARRRYWARASRGWARVTGARPNDGHRALARLEAAGCVEGVVTQNVDGLHQRAGSRRVVELHGALDRVVCLGCGGRLTRETVQRQIARRNPSWLDVATPTGRVAPDGDVEIEAGLATFDPPVCPACAGPLKPDVVFFGENVPKPRVAAASDVVSRADALLVVGSSLAVYSGYRFVRQAEAEGTPVAIVTLGETRGHRHAAVALDARLGDALPALADALGA